MATKCPHCSTQLCDRRSLNKPLKNIHNIFPDVPMISCFHCSEKVRSLPTLRKHSHISHQQPILKVCYTCRVGFQTKLDYVGHVDNEHGMPILDMEEDDVDSSRPTVSSISGGVNYYEFPPGEKDLDIMEYMFRKRDEVTRIIQKHTHTHTNFPKNFKLTLK